MAGTFIKLPLAGGGGGGLIDSLTDTDSVDLTETGGALSADVRISGDAATSGYLKADLTIKSGGTPGLHVEAPFADGSTDGFLSQGDWTTFNGKEDALGYTPEDTANKGVANGYASLDSSGRVPVAEMPLPDQPQINSPSSIGANQNDYALPDANIVRLTASAAYEITGFAAPSSGSESYILVNIGSNNITLAHEDAGSTAANRIIVPWAGDLVITAGGSVFVWYDTVSTRWRAA